VAISHVSNILGLERDISAICELVHRITKGKGHVVVDGVAAAPHFLSSNILSDTFSPAWYVVSLHKLFGPHLGCLLGKRSALLQMTDHSVNDTMCGEEKSIEKDSALSFVSNDTLAKSWELGTANYEACSGAAALILYVEKIGMKASATFDFGRHKCSKQQASNQITSESADIQSSSTVYLNIVSTCIHHVENRLVSHLLGYFSCVPLVRIIKDVGKMKVVNNLHGNRIGRRVPIICFTHANISSQTIVNHCRHHGVICRSCKFLATDRLLDELGISKDFVRFSLAHYNTLEEIDESIRVLELLAGWN
jgi:selenocysteine lyase/cysteine desulfurase